MARRGSGTETATTNEPCGEQAPTMCVCGEREWDGYEAINGPLCRECWEEKIEEIAEQQDDRADWETEP